MKFCTIATTLLLITSSVKGEESMIVAHRGASRDAPENTVAAFNLAWQQGADAIEGDFRLTRDGHIVCIHDGDTERVSDKKLVVHESSLAELRQLDVGSFHGEEFKGTRIPTLAEVLATIPEGKKIFLEIKCGSEIIPVLLKALAASALQPEQVVVICFSARVLRALKAQAPEYTVSWLCSFKKEESGEITPTREHVLAALVRIKADGLSSNMHIPETVLESVKEHGYDWHVWTVNDVAHAKRAGQLGAATITTDVPKPIREGIYTQ